MTRDRALLIFMIILMIALTMAIKVLAGGRSLSDWFALSARSSKRISNNGRFQT
jgi:archaellum biogenesis protein FlaJ (TadC family)